jgi:hypothetical protein
VHDLVVFILIGQLEAVPHEAQSPPQVTEVPNPLAFSVGMPGSNSQLQVPVVQGDASEPGKSPEALTWPVPLEMTIVSGHGYVAVQVLLVVIEIGPKFAVPVPLQSPLHVAFWLVPPLE